MSEPACTELTVILRHGMSALLCFDNRDVQGKRHQSSISTPMSCLNFSAGPPKRWNLGLLLHRHRDVAVRRETNLIAFHVGYKTAVDIVVVTSMPTLATVSLGQLDAVVFGPIYGADMDAIRAAGLKLAVDPLGNVRLVPLG